MNKEEFKIHYNSITWSKISELCGGNTKLTDFITRGAVLDDKVLKAFISRINQNIRK